MDYARKMTGHGFRSLAMGIIKERLGYRHEVVDRQLSHTSGDTYGEAYDLPGGTPRDDAADADYIDAVANDKVIAPSFRRVHKVLG
jgi:hypothetical protein